MFSLLRLLSLLLFCLVGIGLCLGWFSFSTPSPDTENNKVNVNVSIDKEPTHELIGSGETVVVTKAFAEKKGGASSLGWTT